MKIALAQLNYCIGNFEQNTKKIIGAALKRFGRVLRTIRLRLFPLRLFGVR